MGDVDLEAIYERIPTTDALAAERTVLAGERTFLAHLRTSFAMFVTGITGSQLLDDKLLVAIGYALAVASVFSFAWGVYRYRKVKKTTHWLVKRLIRESEE